MIKQDVVDRLLAVAKKLTDMRTVEFPTPGSHLILDATDLEEREEFKVDAQRKGKLKIGKCTYQLRYEMNEILLRLDVEGPPHDNPDGETVPCPHLHIYREGYDEKWAIPVPVGEFPDTTDLENTFVDFLKYCKIAKVPDVQRRMG